MVSLLLAIGFVIALFFSLFLFMAIGMAVSDFAANVFAVSLLSVAGIGSREFTGGGVRRDEEL